MRCLLGLLALLVLGPAAAGPRGPAIPDYPAEEVAPGIYVIHGPTEYPSPQNRGFMNNPTFLVTDQGVGVVDPGSSVQTGEMVLRQIRKITDRPLVAVLNTHVHGDHWLGNQAMLEAAPGLPIYGHARMLAEVAQGAGVQWTELMLRATDGATAGTVAMGPTGALEDGDTIEAGGLSFRVHHYGHVHTDTDLMIEVIGQGVLFLGDNANNRRIVRMDDGSFRGSLEALAKARDSIQAQVLIPGHGRTGGWEIVEAYRAYLAGVYETVAALYAEGRSDFEMKEAVAERLGRFKDWPGFEDELGKHISLAFLEIEAAEL